MTSAMADLSAISETLLLPLYFRAVESRAAQPLVHDALAARMVGEIAYDFSRFDHHPLLRTTTLMRIAAMDQMVAAFCRSHPDAVVVNVGAGLDTRFFRVDTGDLLWYELDLPEVMAVRKRFFKESDRYRMMAGCMFSSEWTKKVAVSDRPVLIIVEGVLLYFFRKEVQQFIRLIRHHLPASFLVLDTVSPFLVWMSRFHPVLAGLGIRFQWGLVSPEEVSGWGEGIQLCRHCEYLKMSSFGFGFPFAGFLPPALRCGFSVLGYRLGGSRETGVFCP